MAEVISILSRKGGVGKTMTALHAAALLAARGEDVAILDKDLKAALALGRGQQGISPFRCTLTASRPRP
ncbi:P-loop NTPase [Deinococcus radiophilus]|uniref:nucleotide-binding protein n=1 Tax=Deinococcus radiophilus TaxID=32062 RepID=UPI00360CB1BA